MPSRKRRSASPTFSFFSFSQCVSIVLYSRCHGYFFLSSQNPLRSLENSVMSPRILRSNKVSMKASFDFLLLRDFDSYTTSRGISPHMIRAICLLCFCITRSEYENQKLGYIELYLIFMRIEFYQATFVYSSRDIE